MWEGYFKDSMAQNSLFKGKLSESKDFPLLVKGLALYIGRVCDYNQQDVRGVKEHSTHSIIFA